MVCSAIRVRIEVFKTNVADGLQARKLLFEIEKRFPHSRSNFDLEDCDKILRIEGIDFLVRDVMRLIHDAGFTCEILQ